MAHLDPDHSNLDPGYPVVLTPADIRPGTHNTASFDLVTSWGNGLVRHVNADGSSTVSSPRFGNTE